MAYRFSILRRGPCITLFINQRYTNYLCGIGASPFDSHSVKSLRLLVGLLDDDEEKVLVRGDEDLLSAGTHSEKCHFVEGIDVTHHASCLHGQIGHVVGNVLWGWCR